MRRCLAALVALALSWSAVARADEAMAARGRREQNAGAALIVIGSVLIVGGGALGVAGLLRSSPNGDATNDSLEYAGIGFGAVGILGLGIGIPLYIAGTSEVDQARAGATATLLRLRF
jgi:hypothetical protein